MRLFIAIRLPKEITKKLIEYLTKIEQSNLKVVKEENIHITLKFIGNNNPIEIIKKLEKIKFNRFEVVVKGIGGFPNRSHAMVIWAGVFGAKKLANRINRLFDNEEFIGHATIARTKKGKIIETNNDEFGKFFVTKFELIESRLEKQGPEYLTIKEFHAKK